ncbi:hypothetical protein IPA_07130 [Ignicoccus pacificus DSM 13166]|uniref:Uncharacterized protein n=1 Tax=Ignicoccus pacificus DSM 13166 TaxID=940294 RepID=A0A977KCT0_9CREN|nr:hypothetical protein IPA_07130 [Ignicoccus pacificus DSM 13166]
MGELKGFVVLMLLTAVLFAASNTLVKSSLPVVCKHDKNAPSPKAIIIHYNTLIIRHLEDPCFVKTIEVLYSKDKVTRTLLTTKPMAKVAPDVTVTLPKPPYTLTVIYADMANNTGRLSWTITAEPYTTHYLVTMVATGGSAVVQINPPPNKPLLPQPYADPSFQASVMTLLAIAAFIYGAIRFFTSGRSS